MPRANKGIRLEYYQPKGYTSERWTAYWYENGRKRERASSITDSGQSDKAHEWFADFLAKRTRPSGPLTPDQMTVAQALDYYGTEHAPHTVDPKRTGYAIKALLAYWKESLVSAVKGNTCRGYIRHRERLGKKPGTIRVELGRLSAALKYCKKEGYLTEAPEVTLPEKPQPKDRWLTRSQVANILNEARKEPKARLHLSLWLLIALYTGHRKTAILTLQWQPNIAGGHVDLERGIIDFNPQGAPRTKKRRSTIPIPRRLMTFLKLARKRTGRYVIEYEGHPVKNIKRSFATACKNAGVDEVSPHVLRHTACTWMMHRGVKVERAAEWVGMSEPTFRAIYWHHHPDYMQEAREAWD